MLAAAIAAPKITFETFAMISFSAIGKTRRCFVIDVHKIGLPCLKFPHHTLLRSARRSVRHNPIMHCQGAADRGEYRRAAGAPLPTVGDKKCYNPVWEDNGRAALFYDCSEYSAVGGLHCT
jgi:hypothetical protein